MSDILFELDKQYAKTQQEKVANNLTDQYDPSYNQAEVTWDHVGLGTAFVIVIVAIQLARKRIRTRTDGSTGGITPLLFLLLPCSAAYVWLCWRVINMDFDTWSRVLIMLLIILSVPYLVSMVMQSAMPKTHAALVAAVRRAAIDRLDAPIKRFGFLVMLAGMFVFLTCSLWEFYDDWGTSHYLDALSSLMDKTVERHYGSVYFHVRAAFISYFMIVIGFFTAYLHDQTIGKVARWVRGK